MGTSYPSQQRAVRLASHLDRLVADRRSARRFPLDVAVELKLGRKAQETCRGKLINISSGGILLSVERYIDVGVETKVKIPWPARLNGTVGLILNLKGQTVRTDDNLVAIKISHSEFRTGRLPEPAQVGNAFGV